jgi:hypothetical protein
MTETETETVSEKSDTSSTLMWMIMEEDFIVCFHCEHLKSYTFFLLSLGYVYTKPPQLLYTSMYRTAGIPLSVKQWVMGLMTGVQFSAGVRDFSLFHSIQADCGVTQPPIQRVSGCSPRGG